MADDKVDLSKADPAKRFQMRRASLIPADASADNAYLDSLAVVKLDPKTHEPMPPRKLTADERKRILAGTMAAPSMTGKAALAAAREAASDLKADETAADLKAKQEADAAKLAARR
jgi:hypothetical protein